MTDKRMDGFEYSVSSVPLFLLLAYSRLGGNGNGNGPLPHFKWRILDTQSDQVERGLVYIVLTWWTIDLAR